VSGGAVFLLAFICVDIGVVIGWCLRVALVRAQDSLPREIVETRLADYNFIARWN